MFIYILHIILRFVDSFPYIRNLTLQLLKFVEMPPIVTGLSPIEGVPGTKVTIRGESLGTSPGDLLGKFQHFPLCDK